MMPSSGLMLSNGSGVGNGGGRMDGTLSQSMDSVNTVAAEEEVMPPRSSNSSRSPASRVPFPVGSGRCHELRCSVSSCFGSCRPVRLCVT